jgi:dihydrofolate synthase/folylpolyglutamate synthase
VTVALAFKYFAQQNVDIAVIEVGLGGRLDSTNIINPIISVITNIGLDHVDILGDTLPQIAYEKAGIIKPNVPVVIGEKHPHTFKTFLEKAKQCNSELVFASEQWEVTRSNKSSDSSCMTLEVKSNTPLEHSEFNFENVELDLTGLYQLKNLATVLSSVIQLKKAGFVISEGHVKSALKQVKNLTGLMGRWQIIKNRPLIICDIAHNEDGIREILKNIEVESFDQLHIVIGMVKDKDINKVLSILPKNARYYFCNPNIPRAKPVKELREEALAYSLKGNSFETVAAALKEAEKRAGENDLIFVGGSTFVVAEIV